MSHDAPDEDVRRAQEALLSQRAARRADEDATLDRGQRALLDARTHHGVAPPVASAPFLRVVTALNAHAIAPATAAARAVQRRHEEQLDRGRLAAFARRAELPEHPELLDVALADAPDETPALVAFREVFEHAARGPRRRPLARVVGGPPGVGKTTAAAWAVLHQRPGAPVRAQVEGNAPTLFTTASAITTTPRNGFSENVERWDRWLSVPVLVVDDAGAEPGDPALLVSLFLDRWNRASVTLVTSNLGAQAFWRRYAAVRLFDRWAREQRAAPGFECFVTTGGDSLRGGAR